MKSGVVFVKSEGTAVPVARSKAELERMLRRYGAERFSVAEEYTTGRVVVMFTIPDTPDAGAKTVDVRFPIETRRVYDRLFGRPTKRIWKEAAGRYVDEFDPKGYDAKRLEQAERVAWRNVILWTDAQLSAASVGIQTVTEAFIAHAALGPNGERLIDVLPALLDPRRMLGAGGDE
jgi:hypothetical protein